VPWGGLQGCIPIAEVSGNLILAKYGYPLRARVFFLSIRCRKKNLISQEGEGERKEIASVRGVPRLASNSRRFMCDYRVEGVMFSVKRGMGGYRVVRGRLGVYQGADSGGSEVFKQDHQHNLVGGGVLGQGEGKPASVRAWNPRRPSGHHAASFRTAQIQKRGGSIVQRKSL